MASYKKRTAGNCSAVLFYYQVSVHNRGDAYSILESDAKGRCRYGCCRRNYSLLQQRKLVSDAEGRCSDGRSRRNHSPVRQRKLESDAEGRCSDGRSRRAILHRHDDYAAAICKSGLEIKNRCTKEGVNGEKLASILKSGAEIQNHYSSKSVLHAEPFFSASTKIRTGSGRSSPPRLLQAEPFFSAATKTGYVSNFKELLFYGVRAAV